MTHAGNCHCMNRVTTGVCACVHALTGKWLELSTSNLVLLYSMARSQQALTLKSKGQRSRSQSYQMCCWRGHAGRYDWLGSEIKLTAVWMERHWQLWQCEWSNNMTATAAAWVTCHKINMYTQTFHLPQLLSSAVTLYELLHAVTFVLLAQGVCFCKFYEQLQMKVAKMSFPLSNRHDPLGWGTSLGWATSLG